MYFEICLLISSISMYTQLYMKKQSLVERVESVSVFSESHECSVALSLYTCVYIRIMCKKTKGCTECSVV